MQLAGRGGLVAAEQDRLVRGVEEASERGLGAAPGDRFERQGGPDLAEPPDLALDQGRQVGPGGVLAASEDVRVGRPGDFGRVDQAEVAVHGRAQGVDGRVPHVVGLPAQQALGPLDVVEAPDPRGQVAPEVVPGPQEPVDPLGDPAEPPDRDAGLLGEPGDGPLDLLAAAVVEVGLGRADRLGQRGRLVSGAAVETDREVGRPMGQDPPALAGWPEVVPQRPEQALDLGGVLDRQGHALAGQPVDHAVGPRSGLPGLGPRAGAPSGIFAIRLPTFGRAAHGCGLSGRADRDSRATPDAPGPLDISRDRGVA